MNRKQPVRPDCRRLHESRMQQNHPVTPANRAIRKNRELPALPGGRRDELGFWSRENQETHRRNRQNRRNPRFLTIHLKRTSSRWTLQMHTKPEQHRLHEHRLTRKKRMTHAMRWQPPDRLIRTIRKTHATCELQPSRALRPDSMWLLKPLHPEISSYPDSPSC